MKKLLQLGIEVNSGSTGRIAEQIGETALFYGWESYITFARGYNPSKSKVIKIGTKFSIYSHVFQSRMFGNHLHASTSSTKELINEIEELKPDIIQLHQIHGYFLNVEVLFKYLSSLTIPVVWTLHDCWAFTGHCCHFSLKSCEKWKTQCQICPQKGAYPKSFFFDRSKSNYNLKKKLFNKLPNLTLVVISDWLKNLVSESYLKGLPIQTINNGVDISVFKPYKNKIEIKEKYNIPDKFMIIGAGTTWTPSKGLDDYYKMQEALGSDCVLVLVGISEKLKKCLPIDIIGITRTENMKELAMLYSAADVLTAPSYLEAFGLTPIEAFACGTPAIVYNSTALPELVTDNVGFIVEPGDIKELINAIYKVKMLGKSNFTRHCIERAKLVYDKEKKNMEYLNLYTSLVNKTD